MNSVQDKIVFVFNKILINFFKEIKKEKFFKLAIKKNYKVIDKSIDKNVKYFYKKIKDFGELLCEPELNLDELSNNEDFKNTNIFKNINIGHLFRVYKDDKDKKVIVSYILTLLLLTMLYQDSVSIIESNLDLNDTEVLVDDDDIDDIEDGDAGNDDEDDDDDGDDDGEDNDDDVDEDGDSDDSEEDIDDEEALNIILIKSLKILNSIDNDNETDIETDLNDILDDDIKVLLRHIKELKVNIVKNGDVNLEQQEKTGIDSMLEDSKIGQLAKEISSQIDFESLNLNTDNPEELLNPANLFGGNSGNLLGNLVQQVGSSITEKMNSGELKQEDLVKDAFSLMNNMQNNSSDNPILNDMMKNMMNNRQPPPSNTEIPEQGEMDINAMMQQMMSSMSGNSGNMDMMQQMMNGMGGTKALNQNNPESRESKTRERLRKKLAEKNNN